MPVLQQTLDQLTSVVKSGGQGDAIKNTKLDLDQIVDTVAAKLTGSGVNKKAATTKATKTTNSSSGKRLRKSEEVFEAVPLYWNIMSYISYIFLVVTGYLRELIWGIGPIDTPFGREYGREGYPALYSSFEGDQTNA